MSAMYDPGQVFAFISLINVEKYTVNVVDFMSVEWTCTVPRCWWKNQVFYQKWESVNVLDKERTCVNVFNPFDFIMLLKVSAFSNKIAGMQVNTVVSYNWLVPGREGVCVCACMCVFVLCISPSLSLTHWLSHSLNVQAGMSPFPRDVPDLTTARSTPHAGNPSHWDK